MSDTKTQQLTPNGSSDILPNGIDGFTPVGNDPAYLIAMRADRDRDIEVRAGLLKQVIAIENRWGLGSRACKHCGKPVR